MIGASFAEPPWNGGWRKDPCLCNWRRFIRVQTVSASQPPVGSGDSIHPVQRGVFPHGRSGIREIKPVLKHRRCQRWPATVAWVARNFATHFGLSLMKMGDNISKVAEKGATIVRPTLVTSK